MSDLWTHDAMSERNTNWESMSDHELGHRFTAWADERARIDPTTAWQGWSREWFIPWRAFMKARFRDWALLRGLPRERWEAVFKEVMND